MHKTAGEARVFFREFLPLVSGLQGVEAGIAPPFTALGAGADSLRGSSVLLGAQNCHWESHGAYTGEVSAAMLREAGCGFVLVGHSERRQLFGETDDTVRRKCCAAIDAGLLAVVCVGETLAEREAGREREVVARQVAAVFGPAGPVKLEPLIFAYEPVWAIGTGRTATADQAQSMHAHIRRTATTFLGPETGERIRILYGGSVKPENASELLGKPDVDGALVGGASLDAETFASIVRFRV
jgi:triosephosphate isomerase